MKDNKIKEIPGFYYDYEKNRYFPLKNCHNKVFSDYLETKNKKLIENKNLEDRKTHIIENKNNLDFNPTQKNPKFTCKNVSFFNLLRNITKFKKPEIMSNDNIIKVLNNYRMDRIYVKEFKIRFKDNKYELVFFDDKNFLLTLDNTTDNLSTIYVEKISLNLDNAVQTSYIREIKMKYKDKKFNTFKIIENLLIVISNYEVFIVRINELFNLDKLIIFYYNLNPEIFNKNNIPTYFDFPKIQLIEKNNNGIYILCFLIYKSINNLIRNYNF